MTHNLGNLVVAIGATVALLAGSQVIATDQGIAGKKLLLKTGKLVLLSKDPGISIAGSNPVGGVDSSISFDDGNGPTTFSLPTTLWSANGAGTLFKYKNASAPAGPSAVKVAKLKSGVLKVVAKGLPFPVPNGAASINVVFSLDGGTNTYCMTFTGTGDGSKLSVKDAPSGSCAPPQTCGNNLQEGTEDCDGSAAAACPGNCLADCTCGVCGNNVRQGTEQCDGSDDATCDGNCLADCTCAVCGNNMQEGTEQCDGSDDAACDGNCLADCTCAVCGNNVREGTEQCDGGDADDCDGDCLGDCTCFPPCPFGGSRVCTNLVNIACNACCFGSANCGTLCNVAYAAGCSDSVANNSCSSAATSAGCAAECCAPQAPPLPCQAATGGFCWFLALDGQPCSGACADAGRAYDPATGSFAGSGGTSENCDQVMADLGVNCDVQDGPFNINGSGCYSFTSSMFCFRDEVSTTSTSAIGNTRRACACQ